MISFPEAAANLLNTVSIFLAGRNSVHTWWTGIIGCGLFGWVFFEAKLYADVTLQAWFIVTCFVGWINWARGNKGEPTAVRSLRISRVGLIALIALLAAFGYGSFLAEYTDAASPYVDSLVLSFSVAGQLLLMMRFVQSWWCWLIVNTIAVPLFFSRELYLTSVLYAVYWVNALVALRHWNQLVRRDEAV